MNLQPYPIALEHHNETLEFLVRPVLMEKEIEYEILKEDKVYFKLQCCTDEVSDTLKLSPQFNSAGIDPELASKVADIVMSEEE